MSGRRTALCSATIVASLACTFWSTHAPATGTDWAGQHVHVRAVTGGPYPERPGQRARYVWKVTEPGFEGYTRLPLKDIDAATRHAVERALDELGAERVDDVPSADIVLEVELAQLALETVAGPADSRACSCELRLRLTDPGGGSREAETQGQVRAQGTNVSILGTGATGLQVVFHADEPSIFDRCIESAIGRVEPVRH